MIGRYQSAQHSHPAGDVVGFLGPNGDGKTTTIRMLLGFLNPSSGSCAVLGGDLRRNHDLRRRIGYLAGDFRMDPGMTGEDLFSWFGCLRVGVNRARVAELIQRLRLDSSRPFDTLSKGNRSWSRFRPTRSPPFCLHLRMASCCIGSSTQRASSGRISAPR